MNTQRPATVTIATVLLTLLGLLDLTAPFVANAIKLPTIAIYPILVVGVGDLVAAFGLWKMKRWGLLLAIIVSALTILAAAPGPFIATNIGGRVLTLVLIVSYALVLVLVALPATRKAFASARVHVTS